ncbi:MAG TPA: hypothetical protein VNN07_07480 [Candidatus Tectomicrobia bacterium]|nr:hypothetical protein [Candidatus Tectomicrobia bacterium]
MRPDLVAGGQFPDLELPDHTGTRIRLSKLAQGFLVETTAPGFRHGLVALPYTFSLAPDLRIHAVYNGWWYVGRPTLEKLRQDLRALMRACRNDHEYRPPPPA